MEYRAFILIFVAIASGAAAPNTNGDQLDKVVRWTNPQLLEAQLDFTDTVDKKPEIKREINIRNIFKDGYVVDKELNRKYRKLGYYLDKATVNDVAINSVSEEKKSEIALVQSVPASNAQQSTIQITGITTGASAAAIPAVAPADEPFKPQRTGSMFARFIDDIFQIPISVLQNVARLITSPFTQKKTPEVVATVS